MTAEVFKHSQTRDSYQGGLDPENLQEHFWTMRIQEK